MALIMSSYNFGSDGAVKYGSNIAQSIIELAVQEINGVAGLAGKGVIIQRNGNILNVDILSHTGKRQKKRRNHDGLQAWQDQYKHYGC